MNLRQSLLGLVWLALAPAAAWAVDLAKIDRTILKEPAYQTKEVKYCLLVFGPEAKTRVWLAQDGDTLYVDRNDNGDLTDPGERVTAEKGEGTRKGTYTFKAGTVLDGALEHRELQLSVNTIGHLAERDEAIKALLAREPQARGYFLYVEVAMPGWKGTGVGGRVQHRLSGSDVHGVLQFAWRPQDAPVIH